MSTKLDTELVKRNKVRFDAAFRDLRKQGILAKKNYTCCMICGFKDLHAEFKQLAQEGREVKGGVFYHAQDASMLQECGQCCLAYCGFDADQYESPIAEYDAAVRIGQIVCETLRRRGVKVNWDGTLSRRIEVDFTVE